MQGSAACSGCWWGGWTWHGRLGVNGFAGGAGGHVAVDSALGVVYL